MNEFELWLFDLRSDNLTRFFSSAVFSGSSIFYMSLVALGFWLRPGGKTFAQFGVLIPLTILSNLILKNNFAILRPDEDFHLIEVNSMLGFPCNEVMIATVFWGTISLRWNNKYLKIFSISMIVTVFIARIYLGVSSLSDAIAGLAFGLIIILLWRLPFMQSTYYSWMDKKNTSYWGFLWIMLVIYFFTAEDDIYSQDFVVATGSLIGFGASLRSISKWHYEPGMFSPNHISSVALSYLMLALLSKAIPTIMINESTKIISGILEYSLLVFMIYSIFPKIQKLILRQQYLED